MVPLLRLARRCAGIVALSVLLIYPPVRAQAEPLPAREQASRTSDHASQATRLERLAALAKLWGEIKYFHPYLAYKQIDWDRALVETIPLVNAAVTPSDYKAAIDHLLGFLGDDSTRTEWATVVAADAAPPSSRIDMKDCVQLKDGVLRVQVVRLGDAVDQQGSEEAVDAAVGLVTQSLDGAKSLVLDLRLDRDQQENESPFFYTALFAALIEQRSDRTVTLGALRYRMHHGYAIQKDTTGYFSSLIYEKPVRITGNAKTVFPPTVVLVNKHTPVPGEILCGLKSTGRVQIIADGSDADFVVGDTVEMTDGLRVKVRTKELVAPDGSIGMKADQVEPADRVEASIAPALDRLRNRPAVDQVSSPAPATLQAGNIDDRYSQMRYPASEYRLLGLFRFWSAINYFYPYRNLIGPSWDDLLVRYIPLFEADKDALAYQMTLRQLVTETHDSHGHLSGDMQLSAERIGTFQPPVIVEFVEQHSVVVQLLEQGTGLHVGDTITTVDGVPIAQRRAQLAPYIDASTPQALERNISKYVWSGPKGSTFTAGVRGADGTAREVRLNRTVSRNDPIVDDAHPRSAPVFRVLPDGFGYVDLDRLEPADVDRMFEAIKGTPATIFDMRGYPNDTAWAIAPRLTRKTNVLAALFSWPVVNATSLGDEDERNGAYITEVYLPKAAGDPYLGKVVMLIDENTQSQAEQTCLFFESATKVTFIGTPTAGANGDVTEVAVPGNMTISFTGLGIRHADGRQLQRIGIQPDIRVAPTVRGIAAGRDEILAAAMAYLEKTASLAH